MHLTYKINKTSDEIYSYLSDMQKFKSVHPIIFKIVELAENEYHFYEKLKFGFISFNSDYYVKIDANSKTKIVKMSAIVKKIIHINLHFSIVEFDGYCIVNEEITFKSFLPVKPFLSPIFKTQHKLLFENIVNI